MNEQILQRLDALATKLGVTAQYLWGVLITQARIEMWKDIGWSVLLAIATGAAVVGVVRSIKASSESRYDSELYGVGAVVCTVIGLLLALLTFSAISSAITEGVNPQYWALEQVLAAAK